MNVKLIAIALAAFLAGDAYAVTKANRAYRAHLKEDEKSSAKSALTWFHLGHSVALDDKERVRQAFSKHFPPAPAQTQN